MWFFRSWCQPPRMSAFRGILWHHFVIGRGLSWKEASLLARQNFRFPETGLADLWPKSSPSPVGPFISGPYGKWRSARSQESRSVGRYAGIRNECFLWCINLLKFISAITDSWHEVSEEHNNSVSTFEEPLWKIWARRSSKSDSWKTKNQQYHWRQKRFQQYIKITYF